MLKPELVDAVRAYLAGRANVEALSNAAHLALAEDVDAEQSAQTRATFDLVRILAELASGGISEMDFRVSLVELIASAPARHVLFGSRPPARTGTSAPVIERAFRFSVLA